MVSGRPKPVFSMKPRCQHPEHNPPEDKALKLGEYSYTCPLCKKVREYEIRMVWK